MDLRIFLMLILVGIVVYGFIEIFRKTKILNFIVKKSSDSKEEDISSEEKIEESSSSLETVASYKENYSAESLLKENSVVSSHEVLKMQEKTPKVTLMKSDIVGSTVNILGKDQDISPGEVISLYIFPQSRKTINGKILYLALKSLNLEFGDTGIFHRVEKLEGSNQAQFSLAVAKEPGSFDLDNMFSSEYPGIVLFTVLSGPSAPLFAFEEMLSAARKIACKLMAEMCDKSGKKLTHHTLEFYRDQVRNSQRRKIFNKEEVLEV